MLPTLQNRLAKLCMNPPKFDVMPESESTDDKDAARLAVQIISWQWEKLEVEVKRLLLYMWVQECGHAYIKTFWDPTKGRLMPKLDEAGQESEDLDYEGDVGIRICSPFEIFPDPLAKSEDELEWLIEAKVRKLDYFKSHYPCVGNLVKQEDAWLLSAQYEQRINSLNTRGPSQGGLQDAMKNCAIELVKYEKRSSKFPNGRMIVSANGILLEDKELPVGELPFAKFDDIIIGGKYYSEAVTTHLRPIQDQYNEVIRRRQQWTNNLLAGKYTAPRGAGLSQESMNDESGEIVYFNPVPTSPDGGRPQPLTIPNIPQWAYAEEDKLNQQFNDISGISEVSRGNMPSASMPAIGMQLLVESDNSRIGVETEQHEHAWAKVGSLILKYIEKNYILPRKLKIAGPNLQYAVKEITGQMIKGNTDVKVIRGSTLPGSKVLKRQEIMNTWQTGLMGPPQDPKVIQSVLAKMEFGDSQGIWTDYALDENQIKRGIELLETGHLPYFYDDSPQPAIQTMPGMPPPPPPGPVPPPPKDTVVVSEGDNHVLWWSELNRLRKSDKFDSFSPEVQQGIRTCMEMHVKWLLKLSGAMTPPPPVMPPPSQAQAMMHGMANSGALNPQGG